MSGPYTGVPTQAPDAGTVGYEHLDLSPSAFGADVGHYLELQVYQNSGAALNIADSATSQATHLTVRWASTTY